MKPIQDTIYDADDDGGVCVKDPKELLVGAAPIMAVVNQSINDVRARMKIHELALNQESKRTLDLNCA